MTTDTRTEAERRYDALKDGSAYQRPGRPVLHTPIDPLVYRAGFVTGRLARMLTHELEPAHAERLLTLLEAITSPAPVRLDYDWIDADDELNKDGNGAIAYTNYLAGEQDRDIAEISFSHRPIEVTGGSSEPCVYMFGRDDLRLSAVEATLPSLLALLINPQVHAARVLDEARNGSS